MTQEDPRPDLGSWYARPAARRWRTTTAPSRVRSFHRELPGYEPTPLYEFPALADELGVSRVFAKDESSRLGLPAFKILGASWAAARLVATRTGLAEPWTLERLRDAATDRALRLVTATEGNHGRAVARMASLLGITAHVIVPEAVPATAVQRIREEGAEVTVVPVPYDQAVAEAARVSGRQEHAELVQDTALPGYRRVPGWIVEGYSTLLRELDEQLDAHGVGPDMVVVPVGVGSLAHAVVAHHRSQDRGRRTAAVLAVEPAGAACVLASLRAGGLRTVATGATVMNGLNCGTPSALSWPVLAAGLDAVVAVADAAAEQAVADLGRLGLEAGASGAATLAAARAALLGPGSPQRRGEVDVDDRSTVALIVTEGPPA